MTQGSIFISYRRDDESGYAHLLHSHLKPHFSGRVFIDVSGITPGSDFVEALETAIVASDVLLVLIGPRWLALTNEEGARRLDESDDFIRLEIVTALRQGLSIIPVLLNGATMPAADELPEDIRELAYRQAIEIRRATPDQDVARLLAILKQQFGAEAAAAPPAPPARRFSRRRILASVGGLLVVSVISLVMWRQGQAPEPRTSPAGAGIEAAADPSMLPSITPGQWQVDYAGRASGRFVVDFRQGGTYEIEGEGEPDAPAERTDDMEQAIDNLVDAFGGLAEAQTGSGNAIRTLLGAKGTWTFDPESQRLTLLPTGLPAGLGIAVEEHDGNGTMFTGTDKAGVAFTFTRIG